SLPRSVSPSFALHSELLLLHLSVSLSEVSVVVGRMPPCRLLGLLGLLVLCKGQEESGTGESCDNFTDLNLSHCFMGTALYVRLLLYTRSNLGCGRELHHHRLSAQPLLDLSRPTAFVIHGYRPTGAPPIWIDHIVHLLSEQEDVNVIVVDWNKGAANLNYFTAEEGASLSSVHLIGVSLGAHLAGYFSWSEPPLGPAPHRATSPVGLDPAGPMFTSATPEDRLDPTDAMFVDVLHTDMNWLVALWGAGLALCCGCWGGGGFGQGGLTDLPRPPASSSRSGGSDQLNLKTILLLFIDSSRDVL
ncbi:hypothetical protein FQN60_013481, partial [Etheostoma spectabile]